MILLMHKETYFNTNEFDPYIPSICVSLLQNCEDIFPNKITSGLPPIRGTKHLKFQAKLNRQHAKWVKFIEMFLFMRKYKQDKKNIVIDVLSWGSVLLSSLNARLLELEYVKGLWVDDEDFGQVYKSCKNSRFEKFYKFNGYLFK